MLYKTRLLAKLELSHIPCKSWRNRLQSFTWNMFHNDRVIVFFPSDAQLVRFWVSSATNESKPKNTSKPIDPQTRQQPRTPTSFEVRSPASEEVLHAKVVVALSGPFQNWRKAMDPSYDRNVYRAEYKHPDSVVLANQFPMGGTMIVCTHPNQLKKGSLL